MGATPGRTLIRKRVVLDQSCGASQGAKARETRGQDEGRATQAPLNCQPAEDTLADWGIRVIYPPPAFPAHLVSSCLFVVFFLKFANA